MSGVKGLKHWGVLGLMIAPIIASGCAADTYVTSEPDGALIRIDGAGCGRTPLTIHIPDKPDAPSVWVFRAEKEGYRTSELIFREIPPQDASAVIPKNIHFTLEPMSNTPKADGRSKSEVSCDVRVISVTDGSLIASATGHASTNRLADLAKALADELTDSAPVKGKSLSVASLRNRTGSVIGRAVTEELGDKLTGALDKTNWFDMKERIDLRSILDEKDLETAGIVKNPDVRKKLAGIKYVVIGGVTVTEPQKP